jgi:carboxymethylenebutenolidase
MKRRNLFAAGASLAIATIASRATAQADKTKTVMPLGKMVELGNPANPLPGYFVTPIGRGPFPAVLVLMEAFGLNDYVKGVCDRLAKAGYAALAPDFYQGKRFAYTDLPGAIGQLKTLKDDIVMGQLGQGMRFLDQQKIVVADGYGVVGFCMGGRFAFLANATHGSKIKAAVAYYGGGIATMPDGKPDPLGRPDLLSQASKIQAPIMFMYGSEDSYIAAGEHSRVALALSTAKKSYSVNLFSQAGHGFDSDRRDSYYAPAAEEAWEMSLRFFDRHLKTKPGPMAKPEMPQSEMPKPEMPKPETPKPEISKPVMPKP